VSRAPHRHRFTAVYAVLVLAAGVALGAALVLATAPGPAKPARWPWQPSGSGFDRVSAIANHVQAEYRSPFGTPLTVVRGSGLEIESKPFVLASRASAQSNNIDFIHGQTVLYELCGSQQSCVVDPRLKSIAGPLTRREGLELAMYTLRNVPASNVVVMLPPLDKKAAPRLILVQRKDVSSDLSKPLKLPGERTRVTPRDAVLVAKRTDPFMYNFALGQVTVDAAGKKQAVMVVNRTGLGG
jgi:hypothetical protein